MVLYKTSAKPVLMCIAARPYNPLLTPDDRLGPWFRFSVTDCGLLPPDHCSQQDSAHHHSLESARAQRKQQPEHGLDVNRNATTSVVPGSCCQFQPATMPLYSLPVTYSGFTPSAMNQLILPSPLMLSALYVDCNSHRNARQHTDVQRQPPRKNVFFTL